MLTMRPSVYGAIAALIFLGTAIAHGLRALNEWELVYNAWSVPIWFSWLLALVGFLMALVAIRNLR